MDTEFINTYIAKQKSLIDEMQTKYLILDTRFAILEQQYNACKTELDSLKAKKSSKGDSGA